MCVPRCWAGRGRRDPAAVVAPRCWSRSWSTRCRVSVWRVRKSSDTPADWARPRRVSGLPRIVAPAVPGVDDPLGARGDPTNVQRWSAVSGGGLFEREDDPAERVLLLATACEPNVVVAHLLAGAGSKRLAAFH